MAMTVAPTDAGARRGPGSRRAAGAAGLLTVGAAVALLLVVHRLAPPTAGGTSPLAPRDVAAVEALGPMLSTDRGATVSVVTAPGTAVWGVLFPDVSGPDVTATRAHRLLVVVSHQHVPQGLRHTLPGSLPVTVDSVELVVDATDGRVLATSTATAPTAYDADLSRLGTVTSMTVN